MNMELNGRRIFVLEDEFLLALEVEEVLREAGAEVVGPALTIANALRLVRKGDQIDAAVLDMNIDGKPSIEVADALDKRKIPYLFATGYGPDPMLSQKVFVLTKPYMPDQLVHAVSKLLI